MRFPRRTLLAGVVILTLLGLQTVFRLAFYYAFGTQHGASLAAFALGVRFDLRLALLVMVPCLVLWAIPRTSPFRSPAMARFHALHLSLLVVLVALFHLGDFAHYAYLRERANASSLRLLEDAGIAVRFLWETYPIAWAVVLAGAFGVSCFLCYRWVIRRITGVIEPGRAGRALASALTVLLVAAGLYGKASYYPLRWSDAFASPRRFDADLALNPILFFCDSLSTAEPPAPDAEALVPYYDRLADFLKVPPEARADRVFVRAIASEAAPTRPNIVIVLAESLAAHQTGMFGNPLNPSPHLDALATDSLLYTRCYSPTVGTARAVFALVTGIPDTSINRTASRNPASVGQYTLLNALRGYAKLYFLGGSASWANVRGLLAHNVEGIRIHEEGSYAAPRGDVWGISDLHLFEEANRVLSRQTEPFLAIVHLSGNHRPFTIPRDHRGFRASGLGESEVRPYGFDSIEEFESFRFMDHSIGSFFRSARQQPYYANTVFFVVGDNGDVGSAPHMPAAESDLGLVRFHTPLLIHGPGIRPGRVDTVVSQIDVLPTAAALAGERVENRTLGRNLFEPGLEGGAFLHTMRGAAVELWFLGDRYCLATDPDGSDVRLYAYDAPQRDVARERPEAVEDMRRLCLGLYLTSRYLAVHNPRTP